MKRVNVHSNYNNVQRNLWKDQTTVSFNLWKGKIIINLQMELNLQNTKSNFEILSHVINLANFKPCTALV